MTKPGRIALVGSGEYLPVMHDVEAWLLEDRPPVFVQLATAAAREGQKSLDYWHRLGAQAAERLGVEQVIVDIKNRTDAEDPGYARLMEGAGLIYLSGGNPSHLAESLRGSATWSAIWKAWRGGSSVAGCSAGAMALCGYVPDFRHPRNGGVTGLGLLPALRVLPHFDRYTRFIPDIALRPLVTDGAQVVGIDEETALVAEAPDDDALEWSFRVRGAASCWRIDADRKHRINGSLTTSIG